MAVNQVFSPETQSNSLKIASGYHTTVAAADLIVTGLSKILSVVCSLADSPTDGFSWVSCDVPSSGGTITMKSWQNTSGNDPTPTAASGFSKKVCWIAVGY